MYVHLYDHYGHALAMKNNKLKCYKWTGTLMAGKSTCTSKMKTYTFSATAMGGVAGA